MSVNDEKGSKVRGSFRCFIAVLVLCFVVPSGSGFNEAIKVKTWLDVQEQVKDTVVQLFVQVSEFNWKEPYKSPKQYEVYGSGFFIKEEGYLASNFHVIEEASSVQIQIPSLGKERFNVNIIGTNPERDVALLKLSDSDLKGVKSKLKKIPYLELGDSDKVRRTSEVLVLGYPLGQEKLKSAQGIVSGREFIWNESYIQVTAPFNLGISGGPSLGIDGKVIGINTSMISDAQNIGYIAPINQVKHVLSELYKVKLQHKAFLGAEFSFSTGDMVDFFGNPKGGGLYISRVYKDTPLERHGVLEGDMVYQINGHNVDMYGEVEVSWSEDKVSIHDLINRLAEGNDIHLLLYRNGEKKEVKFKYGFEKLLPIRKIYPEREDIDYEIIGGMVIMELALNHVDLFSEDRPSLNKYFKKENQYKSRLILTHILPNSQTQKARSLEEGEIIEEVSGIPVKTLKEFRELVKERAERGFLTIKSADRKFMVLSVDKIIEEEDDLALEYVYVKSKLVEELTQKRDKGDVDE